jgi:hypothetical protein
LLLLAAIEIRANPGHHAQPPAMRAPEEKAGHTGMNRCRRRVPQLRGY